MPPRKVTGRGTKDPFREQETGKRPYATDLPYQEAMQKLSQKFVTGVQLFKESEFKKPYQEDNYNEMEYFYRPGGADPKLPPLTPADFDKDCKPLIQAAGIAEGWRVCSENDDCAGWFFSCCHNIDSFVGRNCRIESIKYLPNDVCLVILCSNKDQVGVSYVTKDGKTSQFGPTRSCCDDLLIPAIGYTTQQMTINGTQTLTAIGGNPGPYSWDIIAGAGSLSSSSGTSVIYTAPADNANCLKNPTIRLKDKCEKVATLKIAVDAGVAGNAYTKNLECKNSCFPAGETHCCFACTSRVCFACGTNTYGCHGQYTACHADYAGSNQLNCAYAVYYFNLYCSGAPSTTDVRNAPQRTAGCCPKELIV